ncbi:MAG: hypothetical protein DRP08_07910 [Candidatus Aenigmatarchaeota archaeon]|nr:MAG: hypothetical protein DRP08_07910 [Candidatus Aenigmarchaeota archaeon]
MKMLDDVYNVVEGLSEHGHDSMLETFGKDLDLVLEQVRKNYKKVWTLVDVGKKDLIAVTGYHLCNRINYVITEEEWKNEDEEYIW